MFVTHTRVGNTGSVLLAMTALSMFASKALSQCDYSETLRIAAPGISQQIQSDFGESVHVDGDLAIVGARLTDDGGVSDRGRAFIFRHDGVEWVLEQTLEPTHTATASVYFGEAVLVRDSTAFVGAPARIGPPVVYVFRFDGVSWEEDQILVPSVGGSQFGSCLDLSGDRLLVGTESGNRCFVFRDSGAGWIEEQRLVAADLNIWDRFGSAVAIDGEVAIIGNRDDDDRCPSRPFCDSGSAYIFRFDGKNWNEEQKLVASDAQPEDILGWSVAIDGNIAALGAIGAGNMSRGRVYLFRCVNGSWIEESILENPSSFSDSFGHSVAVRESRSLLVVGVPSIFSDDANRVRMYRGGPTGWRLADTLIPPGDAFFGSSVSISGNRLLIGAYGADDFCPQSFCDSGAVFFFEADASCEQGGVGGAAGPPVEVLLINGSPGDEERTVSVAVDTPLEFSLLASPAGPVDASYLLYVWRGYPSRCRSAVYDGVSAGCLVNPTPFFLHSPQPHRCFRSPDIPDRACRGVREKPGPASAPWTLCLQRGLPAPAVFTLQGILRDDGSGNASGYSASNMVVLEVE